MLYLTPFGRANHSSFASFQIAIEGDSGVDSPQRVEAFLHRAPLDRVPVQLQNMAVAAAALDLDFPQVFQSGTLVARGHVCEWEKYRHDGVIIDIGTHAAAQALG